jgi:hypothetical protein
MFFNANHRNDEPDWEHLVAQSYGSVLDPLMVRCGELFLRGAKEAVAIEEVWDLLNANIHRIARFFDRLALEERIPIFNNGDSFDTRLNFDQRVFSRINDIGNVLYDIDTCIGSGSPYDHVKQAALTELGKLYDGTHRISHSLAKDVLEELNATLYRTKLSLPKGGRYALFKMRQR